MVVFYKKLAKISSWQIMYSFIYFDHEWLNILMMNRKRFIFNQQIFKWRNSIIINDP